uniref:UspA domain-containing protein n=1 Tax=Chlamydomonas euryale TaxID=1486919 RepID=A0A6U2J0P9_9CHLO|mmetsp:Transcript_4570/g.13197  ORF Transcript_4570/g.13197 Transcript_4570/m.13197 type:complete len:160 (+) Transcript_4570:224-703(+)
MCSLQHACLCGHAAMDWKLNEMVAYVCQHRCFATYILSSANNLDSANVFVPQDLGIDEVIPDDGENARKVEAHAKEYLTSTYVPVLDEKQIPYQVEIVSFSTDNDSIGSIICKRAEQVNASAVIMAKHTKGMIKEFIVGSATNYCTRNCRSPVLVMHCD